MDCQEQNMYRGVVKLLIPVFREILDRYLINCIIKLCDISTVPLVHISELELAKD